MTDAVAEQTGAGLDQGASAKSEVTPAATERAFHLSSVVPPRPSMIGSNGREVEPEGVETFARRSSSPAVGGHPPQLGRDDVAGARHDKLCFPPSEPRRSP